jgi:RimJ/RimL family protein N-acetyltransferase
MVMAKVMATVGKQLTRKMPIMIDARQYTEAETLKNGLTVCVRASHPDDLGRVLEAFRLLDSNSVYLRFFGPKKEFSADEIERFCSADMRSQVILLCTIMQGAKEIVIASGTYVEVSQGVAEVAFIVEEDYHRLGIAGLLLKHLGKIALSNGFTTFTAEVLPHNSAMLAVFKRCGWPMSCKTFDGTVHLTLELDQLSAG